MSSVCNSIIRTQLSPFWKQFGITQQSSVAEWCQHRKLALISITFAMWLTISLLTLKPSTRDQSCGLIHVSSIKVAIKLAMEGAEIVRSF